MEAIGLKGCMNFEGNHCQEITFGFLHIQGYASQVYLLVIETTFVASSNRPDTTSVLSTGSRMMGESSDISTLALGCDSLVYAWLV